MTTYFFESITAAQALAFTSADTLVFSNPTSSGAKMTVLYTVIPATPLTVASETVTLTDPTDGHTVVFGPGIQGAGEAGHVVIFPDGSNLIVGNDGPADTALGTAFNDGMFGGG